MEGQGQVIAHAHEADPHQTGLRAAIEGEEKSHDEKPAMLKKVKEKVKKIKEKIGKKKPDEGRDHTTTDSEEEEELEEEEGYKEDDEEPDLEVHGKPMHETSPVVTPDTGKISLVESIGPMEEDPAAPYSSNPPAREGEDIGMSPVIKEFESMNVSEQPKHVSPKPESESSQTGLTGSTDQQNKTYTEKIKSMAAVPAEYGMSMASTVYNKISGMMPENPMRKEKVETSGEVNQDKPTVYDKISGMMPENPLRKEKVETSGEANQDKGVSIKEYLSEKLKPGEEDEALSDVISESMQRKQEEMGQKTGGDVMSVGAQIGAQAKKTGGDVMTAGAQVGSQARDGGVRAVEKICEAVTSVIGGGPKSDVNLSEGTSTVKVIQEEPEPGVIEVSQVQKPELEEQE